MYFGKVTHGGSDWSSPIVTIKKTGGDIRICDEYKIGVNHQICSDSFSLPNIETESHELVNMKYFAKIDLKSSHSQIEIDDKFKEITPGKTPMGLMRRSCLPVWIKTTSHIFQRATDKILWGKLDNIIIYQDDIYLGACTRDAWKSKIAQVLGRSRQAGMTIHRGKYKLDCEGYLNNWRKWTCHRRCCISKGSYNHVSLWKALIGRMQSF